MHTALTQALDTILAHTDQRLERLTALRQHTGNGPSDRLVHLLEVCHALEAPARALLAQAWAQVLADPATPLRPVAGKPGNTVFEEHWAKLCTKGWAQLHRHQRTSLVDTLVGVQMAAHLSPTTPSPLSAPLLAALLLDQAQSGQLSRQFGRMDHSETLTNHADGSPLALVLADWTPSLWWYNNAAYHPPVQAPANVAFWGRVHFPSGQLLVADCLDIGGFHDHRTRTNQSVGLSHNYAWHRIAHTLSSARAEGLVCVPSPSDGPGLVQGADGSLWGARKTPGFVEVAPICHDTWATHIIDVETLTKALTNRHHTTRHVHQAIDNWLKSSRYHSRIMVEPGVWHLLWDDQSGAVQRALHQANIPTPAHPQFALFREKPALDPALALDLFA